MSNARRMADPLVEALQVAGVKRCYAIARDTMMNWNARAINRWQIDWVRMRYEEAWALAVAAAALLAGHLTACAGTVANCRAASTKRGVVIPTDVANAVSHD